MDWEVHLPLLQASLHHAVSIIGVDNQGLIALEKPANVMSHPNGSSPSRSAIVNAAYNERTRTYSLGENGMPLFLLNRLDSPTSGLLLVTFSSEIASAVRRSFKEERVQKTYYALTKFHGKFSPSRWVDRMREQRFGGTLRIVSGGEIEATSKVIFLRSIQLNSLSLSYLELHPITGRTHQLRFQSARRGMPIIGDKIYGDFAINRTFAAATGKKNLWLHSAKIQLEYEISGKKFSFSAVSPTQDLLQKLSQ